MDPAFLPAFEAAFLGQRRMRFAYCDARGTETRREVAPQALLILPPLGYLVARDPLRDDFRQIRMDRISATETAEGTGFRRRRVPFEADICPWAQLRQCTSR